MNQRKEKALAAVLTCSSRTEAAKAAGISTRTLQEYFRDPEFQKCYRKAFSEIVESAVRDAQRAVSPAIQCLKDIVENQDEAATARVSAAKSILDYSIKAAEKLDIVERLDALEAAINENH